MSTQTLPGLAPGGTGTISIQPIDKDGNLVSLPEGLQPVWSRSNDQITITPAEDGLSAEVSVGAQAATDPTSTITVTVDVPSSASNPAAVPVQSTCIFPIDPNPVIPPTVGEFAGFNFTQS